MPKIRKRRGHCCGNYVTLRTDVIFTLPHVYFAHFFLFATWRRTTGCAWTRRFVPGAAVDPRCSRGLPGKILGYPLTTCILDFRLFLSCLQKNPWSHHWCLPKHPDVISRNLVKVTRFRVSTSSKWVWPGFRDFISCFSSSWNTISAEKLIFLQSDANF